MDLVFFTDPSRWNRTGCLPVEFNRGIRQDGTVWTGKNRLIHLDGFDKIDPCKRTLLPNPSIDGSISFIGGAI